MELKQRQALIYITAQEVLIVPYGIETYETQNFFSPILVLIVPYGIETVIYILHYVT